LIPIGNDPESTVVKGASKVLAMMYCTLFLLAGGGENRSLDNKNLQGTWVATKYEFDGKHVPLEATRKVAITFKGDALVMSEEDGDVSGEFQIRTNKKPAWIDVKVTSGVNNGKICLGIIEMRDGMLILGVRRPDGDRPMEFDSKKEVMLLHLKKITKEQ
jgi:uncharacterized protein (TIGR03067 family)